MDTVNTISNVTPWSLFVAVIVLSLFLPLTALTYYFFRRERGGYEVKRILDRLSIDPIYQNVYLTPTCVPEELLLEVPEPADFPQSPDDADLTQAERAVAQASQPLRYKPSDGRLLTWSVLYCTVLTICGLSLLLLSPQLGIDEFPVVSLGDCILFPREGSRLVLGMAFLGAYVWGMQYVFRRYALNDLAPSVYYSLCIRMLSATFTALVAYNATDLLFSDQDPGNILTASIWPTLAFLIGMFPSQGLRWVTDRLPMFTGDATVRPAPLDMVEGIGSYDSLRLAEEGIDNCYDLATADFVPLVLKTPYSARQLIDWMLQAKLCTFVGPAVKDLRQQGIRTIVDLKTLVDLEDLKKLAAETTLTESALMRARKSLEHNDEVERLVLMGVALGQFSLSDDWYPEAPETAISLPEPSVEVPTATPETNGHVE